MMITWKEASRQKESLKLPWIRKFPLNITTRQINFEVPNQLRQ